jgi:prevent-host-death family protein
MNSIDVKNILPLTDFRNQMKKYLKELEVSQKPIILTQHGKSAAVLLSAEAFQKMQDEIEFLKKIAHGLDDYKQGHIYSADKTFEETEALFKNQNDP